ncbi:hypothetical protein [Ferrimonas balearica]|uniref:hypothetical protein n=1 Tax=Ferrimonas balearica TaxID=44012 RepID=UPI001C97003F|nr:hypothetical protein [Ferrimonas balearica]MBY6224621.1 hypothetical protein [Ferrimonas balearica]
MHYGRWINIVLFSVFGFLLAIGLADDLDLLNFTDYYSVPVKTPIKAYILDESTGKPIEVEIIRWWEDQDPLIFQIEFDDKKHKISAELLWTNPEMTHRLALSSPNNHWNKDNQLIFRDNGWWLPSPRQIIRNDNGNLYAQPSTYLHSGLGFIAEDFSTLSKAGFIKEHSDESQTETYTLSLSEFEGRNTEYISPLTISGNYLYDEAVTRKDILYLRCSGIRCTFQLPNKEKNNALSLAIVYKHGNEAITTFEHSRSSSGCITESGYVPVCYSENTQIIGTVVLAVIHHIGQPLATWGELNELTRKHIAEDTQYYLSGRTDEYLPPIFDLRMSRNRAALEALRHVLSEPSSGLTGHPP